MTISSVMGGAGFPPGAAAPVVAIAGPGHAIRNNTPARGIATVVAVIAATTDRATVRIRFTRPCPWST
ncbi:MAG: hypothetical protein QM783_17555 [Phycisphaerales bacterium]